MPLINGMSKYLQRLSRVIEHPKVLFGKILGVQQTYALYCLTVKDFIPNVNTVIDVGASDGIFIKASKFVFPNAKVYAFEPIRDLYEKIEKRDFKDTEVFNFALGNKNTIQTFNYNPDFTGVSSFLNINDNIRTIQNIPKTDVKLDIQVKRFSDLNLSIQRPCFLKIDVEGYELNVLKGFGDRLKEIDAIQIECLFKKHYDNEPTLSDTISYLKRYNFSQFIQKNVGIKDNEIFHCDLIFFKDKELRCFNEIKT